MLLFILQAYIGPLLLAACLGWLLRHQDPEERFLVGVVLAALYYGWMWFIDRPPNQLNNWEGGWLIAKMFIILYIVTGIGEMWGAKKPPQQA